MRGNESPVSVLPVPPEAGSSAPRVRRVDLVAAERAARDLLAALGTNVENEALAGTPARVARSFAEMLDRPLIKATTFPNDEAYDELVVLSSVPFHSLCEHHLLPLCRDARPRARRREAGTRTVTSALRGKVRDDPRTRQEFLDLTQRG